tara:strand:+ start:93 stop:1451 length:1359 start_codon:yes stop_codon:yes gene_type:complete
MNREMVLQLLEYFKESFGLEISSAEDLFETQRNLLEYLIKLGRGLENKIFEELGKGYEGATIEKDGTKYKFIDYRGNTIHGLFGEIHYQRAYYVAVENKSGSRIPLDEMLGIEKRHSPGLNYFLSSFTGRDAYQESLNRFHEIFRPDGKHLVSMRKALDMDYELGGRIEQRKQEEIGQIFDLVEPMEKQRVVEGTVAVSIDATKLREKQGEYVDDYGKRRYEIGFRDAKIAVISEARWDSARSEAYCADSTYVGGIEHADEFFRRVWVEMNRRIGDPEKALIVFLADGANWIWDRVSDLANDRSISILDFYHATEHLSDLCKELYGEQTEEYWRHFTEWRQSFLAGAVQQVIAKLKQLRDECKGGKRDLLQGEINYFEEHEDKMHYDQYRAMHLPIGSGTVESSCKNVIGGRMKQGGMTWSESGAEGMLQIRTSLCSERFQEDFLQTLRMAS